jgi:RNA polymerase sigma-70 factor (ECF subfamily)
MQPGTHTSAHGAARAATRSANRSYFTTCLSQARDGSPAALGQLLEATRPWLLALAQENLDDDLRVKLGASDMVQDTFVEAQGSFGRFNGRTERELHAWLSTIFAHRLANAIRRHRGTHKRSTTCEVHGGAAASALGRLPSDSATPRTNLVVQEEWRRLQEAINSLPATVRDTLSMRIWGRASFAEIGAAQGCTAEAARKRFFRAFEELRVVLDPRSLRG